MTDYVVLVNEKNEPIGTMPKLEAHNDKTPLHRGFSIFLFNTKRQLLLQQRSMKKKTWPGVWSNSCCGHPMINESPVNAAKRRLQLELGITASKIIMILPHYRYTFTKDKIVENEFCPVMIGVTKDQPIPNPDEIGDIAWIDWDKWLSEITKNPEKYSEWCIEETNLLKKNLDFQTFLENLKS